jgi:GMP synthase (glutamine-hydrolysing)
LRKINDKEIKGVIFSGGGPCLDKKIKISRIRADISALLRFDVPIFGICLGHELIAEIFGGSIRKLRKKSINSKQKIKILKKSKIFRGLPSKIEAYEHHSRFVRDVPNVFELAATSEKDEIEALFHKEKLIFSVQFHPERMGETGEKIFENFFRICKLSKR